MYDLNGRVRAVVDKHDIIRFEIEMGDMFGVHIFDGVEYLFTNRLGHSLGQFQAFLDSNIELSAGEIVEDQIDIVPILVHFVQSANVRVMLHLVHNIDFILHFHHCVLIPSSFIHPFRGI